MADTTNILGFYKWDGSDHIERTVDEQTQNWEHLESILLGVSHNVKDYGAKGDMNLATQVGTDDTLVFQKILNLAKPTQASVTMYIPDGVYKISQELKLYSNTKIVCAPNARIVRAHAGYLLMNGNRNTEPDPSTAPKYTGRGNLAIYGGIWDGNGANQQSKASIFHLGHAEGLKVIGATLRDCYNSHHIEFNACKNVLVENCKFLGWFGGTDTFNEVIQLDLPKENPTIFPADNTPCEDVWILNNYFGDSDTAGAKSFGRAFGSHTSTIGRWHKNVTFSGNTVVNSQSFAVRLYSTKNFVVTENNFVNCAQGINVRTPIVNTGSDPDTKDANGVQTGASQPVENGDISANTFEGGLQSGRGIEIYGEPSGRVRGVTVANNSINAPQSGSDVILLNQAEDCTVTGNRISAGGSSKVGIWVRTSSFRNLVTNNTLDLIGTIGIYLDSCYYATVTGNTVSRVGTIGILIEAGETHSINGNVVVGANGNSGAGTDNNHVRAISSAKRLAIVGNTFRDYSTTHKTTHAVNVLTGCTDVVCTGNVGTGFTLLVSATNKVNANNLGTMA